MATFATNQFDMSSYNMLYEELVVAGWGKTWPTEIPEGINPNAGLLGNTKDDLSGDNGYDVRLGLSSAVIKAAIDNADKPDVFQELINLNREVWLTQRFNDIIKVMEKIKTVFEEKLGKILIH